MKNSNNLKDKLFMTKNPIKRSLKIKLFLKIR